MPLVSVVIPTYNRGEILKDTLESVFSQSFSDFEVFVIDDGSSESIDHLIQQYGERATFIRLPHSGLPAIARNCGIKKATGRYIAFLDSDDLWLTEKLKTQVQAFSDHPEIALVCSDAYILKPGTQQEKKPYTPYLNDRQGKTGFLLDDLINNNFVITSTCMVRRDILQKTGGFSEDPTFRGIEDYELWLRIARQNHLQYIPKPLAYYSVTDMSLRKEISRLSYYDGIDGIYSTLISDVTVGEQYNSAICRRLNQKIYENQIGKLCTFFEMGNWIHFRSLLKKLVMSSPVMVPKICTGLLRTYIRHIKPRNTLNKSEE